MNRRLLIRALAPLALAATLAACGDDTDAASGAGEDTTTTEAPGTDERERDPDDHPDGGEDATEVGESAPRLLVADGTDAVVTVIDLATAEEITELQVTGPARLTAVGRHVLAAQREDDLTDVIDAGAWSEVHGDHFHHFTSEPGLSDLPVLGQEPTHVVPHDGVIAVFHDGDGSVTVLDADHLGEDDAVLGEIDSGAAHHGVAVAFHDLGVVLVSTPVEGESLPDGVAVVDLATGDELERHRDCPGLHGELSTHDAALFGCTDGVLVLEAHGDHWDATKVPNPDGAPEDARTGSFVGGHDLPYAIGTLADEAIVRVDIEAGASTLVPLPSALVSMAFDEEHEVVVALTDDGLVHRIDPMTGEVLQSTAVLDPIELPDGHGGPPVPRVVVAGNRAYVTDPEGGRVMELGIDDELRLARELAVGGSPADVAVVGLAPTAHG